MKNAIEDINYPVVLFRRVSLVGAVDAEAVVAGLAGDGKRRESIPFNDSSDDEGEETPEKRGKKEEEKRLMGGDCKL